MSLLTTIRAATRLPGRRGYGQWPWLLEQIESIGRQFQEVPADELRRECRSLRFQARSGVPLSQLLTFAYALMREACQRTLAMKHYPVQLRGAIAMHFGGVVEMATGEGKTLTACLPLMLASLEGNGAHLATANDYLATRDAELLRPAFELLGLTVGVITADTPRIQRRRGYFSDVTYSTSKEFGFDFLRDRLFLASRTAGRNGLLARMLGQIASESTTEAVQRQLHFALIDEADSILIDEARTPLIVSAAPHESKEVAESLYRWAAQSVAEFADREHYVYDERQRSASLSAGGRRRVREMKKPALLAEVSLFELYEKIETALKVDREFARDQHFVVRDDEVVIVDEFTGRLSEGRKWREGIHQAVEAKEGLPISSKTGDAARITVQDFFLLYESMAGMTGTAWTSRREFRRIYDLAVIPIPTHRVSRREQLSDRVFATAEQKWDAVVAETQEMVALGRPVLIGTRTIHQSERLADLLRDKGVTPELLNARHLSAEAEIVSAAGRPGRVTVATNMAGRGTDIQLFGEVEAAGGLHVVCTELHESARVDRQLIGRCARQGDPGSFRQYMSLEDDILEAGLGKDGAERLRQEKPNARHASMFRKAQQKAERSHFRQRRLMLYHEKQRRQLQKEMGQDPYLDG